MSAARWRDKGPELWIRREAHRAVLQVLIADYGQRRASPELLALWAVIVGKQKPPSPARPEGFTDSTDSGGRNGCNTDGA